MKITRDKKLAQLLKDYDYRVEGNTLIRVGIRGWSSDRVVCRVRSLFDAAEMVCPIVADPEYTTRLIAITKPSIY